MPFIYRYNYKKNKNSLTLVYIGLKTNSTYKTANIISPKNVNTYLRVGYVKCHGERKLEGLYTSV